MSRLAINTSNDENNLPSSDETTALLLPQLDNSKDDHISDDYQTILAGKLKPVKVGINLIKVSQKN